VIIEMARVRVLGPRGRLGDTIRTLQERGVLHLVDPQPVDGLRVHEREPAADRHRRDVTRALADVEHALADLSALGATVPDRAGPPPPAGQAARIASRVAAEVAELRAREQAIVGERDALREYEPLVADLEPLFAAGAPTRTSIFLLRLRGEAALAATRDALERLLDGAVELRTRSLATGDVVLLALVPTARAPEIERYLAGARVEHAPLPAALASSPLAESLPRLRPRLAELARELAVVRDRAAVIAALYGADLARALHGFHDDLLAGDAETHAAASARAFVLEGWLPARELPALERTLVAALGPEVAVEEIARDEWRGEDAPVVLANPPLFAPFEKLTALLPLPRYGTVDPTPFVAVFFPMLFGVIAGDVGYGAAIGALALVLRFAVPRARDLAKIAGAVAIYTIVFGLLYGELFGDLGRRWFGMHALWFDRRDGVLGFLVLAVALGLVHLVLGLVVAAVSRWRGHRREAIGRGLTALMLVLVAIALLALFHRVPAVLLRPAMITLLVALPIVVVLEGATALLDFMTIAGHVLSYARVMALGTASVMLALVANRMYGAFGSAAVGFAFALVFHLVNFAITLFSPTIQVMRLHYVEFFDTFFQPGGERYRPLRHWSPTTAS